VYFAVTNAQVRGAADRHESTKEVIIRPSEPLTWASWLPASAGLPLPFRVSPRLVPPAF
jgi:hypothetical protein